MAEGIRAPKQQRSRETLSRLLRATIEVLDERGLAGATIPRIAAAAGVAPASVYRRFEDRDALLRAVFIRVLEKSAPSAREAMRLETLADKTLEGAVRALVGMMLQQYVQHPGLMRAFVRFLENDSDRAFREQTFGIVSGNFLAGVDLLLKHFRGEIRHSNPKRVITFALLSAATIVEARAMEEISLWDKLLPLSDTQLQHDLTRMILAYLGSRLAPAGTHGQ